MLNITIEMFESQQAGTRDRSLLFDVSEMEKKKTLSSCNKTNQNFTWSVAMHVDG